MENKELLVCPYCGREQLYTHMPEDTSICMGFELCEHCHRRFRYSVIVTRKYKSWPDEEGES